jgi:thiol-disulfide isomerase/thioredoxin
MRHQAGQLKKFVCSILLFVFLIGCQAKKAELSHNIEMINETTFKKLTAERDDKALFVNVWATWCIPCREEFPDLIKLAEKYDKKKIEFIGISADYADEIGPKVKPFLENFNLNFKIYVQDFENEEAFINSLNKEWSGALPATFIFNSKGEQKIFLAGKKSFKEFDMQIEKVLN